MNWHKILRHDVICGLFRTRYLFIIILGIIPCLQLYSIFYMYDCTGDIIDYLLYAFKGIEPVHKLDPTSHIILPMYWLLLISTCLFVNLDYTLRDLTIIGQQILIRCHSKNHWFLSKCVWCTMSTLVFYLLLVFPMCCFTIITGGTLTLQNTPEVFNSIFFLALPCKAQLSIEESLIVVFIVPYLSITAFCFLEMVLCLYMKPVVSFLICLSLLVLSIYLNTPLALGNGAMVIRSTYVAQNGHSPFTSILVCICSIIVCIIIGSVRFKRIDLLGLEV